ncbi:MAG: TIGR03905 family TSCPD domain-containing protein [Tidjanibacter sp.]|nr:TIGR03905 family TSCPD domain-containing protein [Tidjanibacter sp.]
MSKSFTYFPMGVCSRQIEVTVSDEGVIEEVLFWGGCHGNTQGVAALAKGRKVEEVVALLKGIDCRGKGTSCPDQLARALEEI